MAGGHAYSPWVKLGKQGIDPISPGSYGGWVKMRRPPKSYDTLPQQKAIGDGGRKVGEECKGKTGAEYRKCRHTNIYHK